MNDRQHASTGLKRRSLLLGAAAAPAVSSAVAARGPVWTPAALPPQAPASEFMVDVGGCRLWTWDTGGTGEAVVFLHAGSQSGAGWGYQQPVFAQAGYRAIAYSRRGCFRSESGDPKDPGMAAEDLRRVLDDRGIDKVHVVALALGAFYALDFALLHPARLRTLTIASSYLGIADSEAAYFEANARLRPPAFNALPVEFKELHPSYRAGNPAGVEAWLALSKQARSGPAVVPRRPWPMTWERVESIRHPILLMTGDGDLYTPPALLRMQAQHMRHAEVVVIPEAGHCANWEQPEAFNRTVLGFLKRHAGR